MSLRQQIQAAVQTGLAALDDIPELSVYTGIGTPVYDPNTGNTTKPSTISSDVPMVFTSFSFMEIDNLAVLASDRKAIIATLDLDQTPTLNDTITRPDGKIWNVIGIKIDPAGAAWVLQIRRP